MNLPTLDPTWVSVLVTTILVFVTAIYVRHTKKMVDLAKNTLNLNQMSLLYQRKPNFTVKIDNNTCILNDIWCSIKNNVNSISPVSNITVKFDLNIDNKKIHLGKYHVNGPLFPGEEDALDLTYKIRKILLDLQFLKKRKEMDFVKEDEQGLYIPTLYDLAKGTFEFEILLKISYEIDIKINEEKMQNMTRIYNVKFTSKFAPPDSRFDLYDTSIGMKSGDWSD